jgi:hypothetical protein
MKEQKEAKKKEADAATFVCAPVQSTEETTPTKIAASAEVLVPPSHIFVLTTDLKPRTVSSQGEEDDVAPYIFADVSDATGKSQDIFHDLVSPDMKHTCLSVRGKYQRECYFGGTHQPSNHAYSSSKAARNEEFHWDFKWRNRVADFWFQWKVLQERFLYLFLPCKEKYGQQSRRTFSAWRYLSLKSIGWGPPAPAKRTITNQIESVYYC